MTRDEALIERMARAACNALDTEVWDPAQTNKAALGHRHGYETCVAPDCSCWQARKAQQAAVLEAIRPDLIPF